MGSFGASPPFVFQAVIAQQREKGFMEIGAEKEMLFANRVNVWLSSHLGSVLIGINLPLECSNPLGCLSLNMRFICCGALELLLSRVCTSMVGFGGILEGSSGISVILVVPSTTRVTPAGSGTTSQSKKLLILCTSLNLLSICAVPEGAFTAGFAGLGNPSTAGTQGGCGEAFPGHCDNLCSWNSWKGGEKVQEVQRDSGVCSAMNET